MIETLQYARIFNEQKRFITMDYPVHIHYDDETGKPYAVTFITRPGIDIRSTFSGYRKLYIVEGLCRDPREFKESQVQFEISNMAEVLGEADDTLGMTGLCFTGIMNKEEILG